MIHQQTVSHHWHEIAGKLRDRWNCLTADDIHAFNGNVDELVEKIARLTGESREEVQQYLDQLGGNVVWIAEDLREKTAKAASQAMAGARQSYDAARAETVRTVKQNPVETAAVAFGLGLLAGVAVAILTRPRPQPSPVARTKGLADELASRIADAIANVRPETLAKHFKR